MLLYLLSVGLKVSQTVLSEGYWGITDESNRMENISPDQGFKYIQLKMSIHATDGYSCVVSHHLCTYHRQGFTLGWIHFPRHDTWPRLILRQDKLTQSTTRATPKKPNIISDLHQANSNGIESSVKLNHRVFSSQALKLIRSRYKLIPCLFGHFHRKVLSKPLIRVQASADSCSSLGESW